MRRRGAPEIQKPKDTGNVLRRLIPYFAEYKVRLAVIAVLLVMGTLMDLAAPYLIGVAVDQFIAVPDAPMPGWLSWLLGPDASRTTGLTTVMIVLTVTYATVWGLNVAQFRLMVRVSQRVLLVMRTQILDQLHRLSLDFFDDAQAGDLMSRLTNDTQVINDMFGPGLMRLLRMSLTLVGIVVAMLGLNWRLALASFSMLPIILIVTVFFSQRVRRAYRETRKTIGDVSAELQENISGVREVQAFARESATIGEFRTVNERNRMANVQAETISSLFMPVLDVLSTTAMAIVVGFGGYLVLGFTPALVTVGIIVAFLNYVRRFYEPIREMANLYGQMQSAIAGAERIFELLDTEPSITDHREAAAMPPSIDGQIVYDNVSFAYNEDEPVLDSVSAEIEPGQMVALVGPTGAGKTTFVSLLLRFYDTQQGSICIDGHDVRSVSVASLRRMIGIVPQDTYLFSSTIMENIRYGRLDASDEEVIEAAKIANAHEFIQRLPEGYQSQVGERGSLLSQGNRQMVAIARAILNSPRILVLDEATSSVDTRTELLIQEALEQLMADRTSVVIAHRLSTIRKADQIFVIQDGQIVERGNHTTLLAQGGAYHDLYMSQFRRQEEIPQTLGAARQSL